jgi:hypothetical protein
MKQAARILLVGVGIVSMSCTSARENNEFNAAAPSTINSDEDRRAIYNNGAATNTPSSTPRRLDNSASEINRQKNIEGVNETRPPEVRTRELGRPTTDTGRTGL